MITDVNSLFAAIGGGENDVEVTNQHRKDFNDYTDWLDKRGMKGNSKLDENNLGKNLLTRYAKQNPNTSLTPDHIIAIQNDLSKAYPDETTVINGLHSSATGYKYPDEYIKQMDAAAGPTDAAEPLDWATTGTLDTKVAASKLKQLGLIGADQIIDAQPNPNDADSIKNSQADWKPAAIQQIVQNAIRLKLRGKEEILANKDVLVGNPRWRDAINNDSFKSIHPNFWNVITEKILPEQYSKIDKTVAKK